MHQILQNFIQVAVVFRVDIFALRLHVMQCMVLLWEFCLSNACIVTK